MQINGVRALLLLTILVASCGRFGFDSSRDTDAAIDPDAGADAATDAGEPEPDALALWLSADFGTLLSGSNVVTWEDRSGNGRHASQNTAGSRPMLVDNAVGGKPAIQFDGIDDNLIFDMPVNMLSGMTIAMVSANTLDGNGGSVGLEQPAIFWNETTSWGLVYLTPYQTNIVYRFGTTQTGNLGSYTRSVNVGNAFTQTMSIKDGTTDSLYVGGVLVDSAGGKLNQIAGCINTARIGSNGSSAFSGLIAEILVYTKALSQSERDALTSYFTARYPGGLVSGL